MHICVFLSTIHTHVYKLKPCLRQTSKASVLGAAGSATAVAVPGASFPDRRTEGLYLEIHGQL